MCYQDGRATETGSKLNQKGCQWEEQQGVDWPLRVDSLLQFSISRYNSMILKWWPETGLNRRRRPFQGRALPLSYLALAMHNA